MSGLKRFKREDIQYYLLLTIYFLAIFATIGLAYISIQSYNKREVRVREHILSAIDESTRGQKFDSKPLDTLNVNAIYDVVIMDKDGVVFQTVETTNFSVLKDTTNPEAVSFQSIYEINQSSNQYLVWVVIYPTHPQNLINQYFIWISISVIVSGIALAGIVQIMYLKLVRPLSRFKTYLNQLASFKLKDINDPKSITQSQESEYDALVKEIQDFALNLDRLVYDFGDEYLKVEKQLLEYKNATEYKNRVIGTLIHDLKTPLNLVYNQLDDLGAINDDVDSYFTELTDSIKYIIKVVNIKKIKTERNQQVDIVKIIKASVSLFSPITSKKNVMVNVETPSASLLAGNQLELTQLIKAIYSNAVKYVDTEGVISIDVNTDMTNKQIVIDIYNDFKNASSIEFDRVFDLLYYGNSNDTSSSGLGLYSVSKTIEDYNGSYAFTPYQEGVLFKVVLPMVQDND